MLSHSTWETLRPTAKIVEFGVFSRRVISGGYLCGLRIILSYDLKQNSSGFNSSLGVIVINTNSLNACPIICKCVERHIYSVLCNL